MATDAGTGSGPFTVADVLDTEDHVPVHERGARVRAVGLDGLVVAVDDVLGERPDATER